MNGPTFAPQPDTRLVPAPRPAARPARPAPPPAPPAGPNVVAYLRLHWLMILFAGGLLGAGLAAAAWNLLPVKYESYAMLQVSQTPFTIASTGDPARGKTDFITYVKTQEQLLRSNLVLNSALNNKDLRIADLPTLKEQKDPIKYLEEKLIVKAPEGSEIIRISLEGERPDDLQKIVDAVHDAHRREIIGKDRLTKAAHKQQLDNAQADVRARLGNMLLAATPKPAAAPGVAQPIANTGATTTTSQASPELPGGVIVDNGVRQAHATAPAAPLLTSASPTELKFRRDAALKRADVNESALAALPMVIAEKQGVVAALRRQLANPPAELSPQALATARNLPQVEMKFRQAEAEMHNYHVKRAMVPDKDGAAMQQKRAGAEALQAEAERMLLEKAQQLDGPRVQARTMELARDLDQAEQVLSRLLNQQQLAQATLKKSRDELASLPPEPVKSEEAEPKANAADSEIATQDDLFRSITRQAMALEQELKSPPRVQELQRASTPSLKDSKKQLTGTLAAGLMGFALVALGAVGYEARARKVSSLAELRSAGPVPVVGVVPWVPDAASLSQPLKRADLFESIDKLRAYVAQNWLERGARTVAVTSPLIDEGRAFTAFRLASSLANAGVRTLVIDFDLRRPTLHALAGVPNATGMCEILRGETDLHAAQIVLPNGLAFLPAGVWGDPTRTPSGNLGAALDALLTEAKRHFDCVVLHGHSLLTVADAIEVVRRADAVLLCTLYRDTRMPLLKRAMDRLASLDCAQAGVVYLGASPHEALC